MEVAVCILSVILLLVTGCVTDQTYRPIQGLNQSCTLYVLADYAERTGHSPITREDRLRVWMQANGHWDRGLSLLDAWALAAKAGRQFSGGRNH
jgi:hypothetical protein